MNAAAVNILLVEDDDIDAMTVTRGLQAAQIHNPLIRAHDGVEALDLLLGSGGRTRLAGPYVLLVDIRMPRLDGLNLVRQIRANRQLQRTVIFMLTTSSSDRDQMAAYDEHVAGYIVKSDAKDQFVPLARLLEYFLMIVSLPTAAVE